MGHLVAKDMYERLGNKVDNLHVRAPVNAAFAEILKELYSLEEAEVVVKMPYVFSSLDRISKLTKTEKTKLKNILDGLCLKGLVMDIYLQGEYRYMPSPLVVGIFEFTMMRTEGDLNSKHWARLFHDYMEEGTPYYANFTDGSQVSIARALPHEDAIEDHIEILDYEKVSHVIDEAGRYAVGLCSCRHKAEHTGERLCDVPMSTCTTLGHGADYLIRNKMAQEVSKSEMLDIFARSKELGLIFSADNVQKRLMFICHCCGCCCGIIDGLNKHGLTATLVTSNYIASVDAETCNGCKMCEKACHVKAISMKTLDSPSSDKKKKKRAVIDEAFCVGCGVCALKCKTNALKLVKRKNRVIHPKTTFERVILQCLERGTLQNQLFDNPESVTQNVMRNIIGGFLKLPSVKKALMSDVLRSSFLTAMNSGVKFLGKGYLHDL
ncbi:MAG: 4Fe-4S dicluster domain-containing protein [Proteobacteria bacterium]|nr:4Fe-4S dicluster domain-containing protein [Pseudomonadota bacterium]